MSWHTKSSSVHLQVFFYSFPALTLILLMIKHLKHFKTKLFTFRYFFFPLYEKDRYLAGIYLPTCSLAPQPKNILKHVPFHLGALYVPTTHSLIFLFYFILFRGWFIFFFFSFSTFSSSVCSWPHGFIHWNSRLQNETNTLTLPLALVVAVPLKTPFTSNYMSMEILQRRSSVNH